MSSCPSNQTAGECASAACMADRQDFYFFLSGAATLAFAMTVVLLFRLAWLPCRRRQKKELSADEQLISEPSVYVNVQNWAGDVISGNTTTGRFLVVFAFCCSVAALGIYIYDTHDFPDLEHCVNWRDSVTLQMDFALSIFFTVYFFFRFLAAEDKVMFLVSMESLVDFFTVPSVYLSVYLDRAWLGLRFLRALIFLDLPDVLVYVRVISSSSSIKLSKLISVIIASVLGCAGLCYFLENSGDPWKNYSNKHDPYLAYGDCLYYMFVTMSTVGFGDIYCQTDWGKVFIIFYICGALAMFANFLPEIAILIGNRPKYTGDYKPNGRQFIIVCGNINYESVQTFLEDFFHPARDDVDVEVLFLNKAEPDLEFEGLLKREHTRVQYFRGSMLNAFDLQRVRADQAAACLVLANKFCEAPDAEDAANIMRVISLKNYCEDTRVIIQLMMYHNKAYLLNIPGWDWRRDDQAVCLNELKLGFIAQSCLARGFSTLVSNLVMISSPDLKEVLKANSYGEVPKWKVDYFTACNKVILAETLSPTFVGMQFSQVADICYTQLNLLLLAIEARKYEGGEIYINPKDKVINPNAIGLFMTDSVDSAKRAWFYCRKCHANIKNEKQVVKCDCKRTAVRHLEMMSRQGTKKKKNAAMVDKFLKQQVDYVKEGVNGNVRKILDFDPTNNPNTSASKRFRAKVARTATSIDVDGVEQSKMQYDSTGMYHWCPSREINACLMDRQDAAMTVLQNHIIVAVFADDDSPLIGLRNLVMPLRASNIQFSELLHVVILGDKEYLQREWKLLRNLPKISVLDGSPLSRADLRAVKIDMCRLCVILSAKVPSRVEPVLADKEVLLTALNIKAMSFTDIDDYEGDDDDGHDDELDDADIRRVAKKNSILGDLMDKHNSTDGDGGGSGGALANKQRGGVPIMVDLAFASNVRFLDDHELHLDNVELYKTLPYAAGQALARGVLDSLMSTTYFNASALRLIRSWVTGGATIELELALAEGAGLRGGYSTPETLKNRDRFKVAEVPLLGSVFSKIAEECYPFGVLFGEAASKYAMLCIGISRVVGIPGRTTEQDILRQRGRRFTPKVGKFLTYGVLQNVSTNLRIKVGGMELNKREDDVFGGGDGFGSVGEPEESSMRIVISAPDKNMPLEKDDIAFMLIQYEDLDEQLTMEQQ